ncbi:MAG: hypothetical protein UY48_C0002G0047 [Candidatus Gottesmanbacteria bacterium GW2011_GWB1_49_7]|uniref:Uncharacterized protein n=1 Tax=Candidatus Gottesmanbacteria bacterium GW2011_GWB1_49_7 TaxID=1618448 RepID=A0A0G1W3L1_9BACT|nr:MAG: hypothetical protein UY48_C0002G0047 [Candidatus Gottesmanbacteria bacterium GW2011_GWB1_49_7]
MQFLALEFGKKELWERQNPGESLREADALDMACAPFCPGCGREWGETLSETTCDGTCQDGSGWTVFVIEEAVPEATTEELAVLRREMPEFHRLMDSLPD